MRWITFILASYVLLGVQIGLGDLVRWGGAIPNFVLMLVVLVALNASRDAALLGCLILGFFHDLVSGGPIGLLALSYGLVALMIVQVQNIVYRDNPITHFFATFIAAGIVSVIYWAQGQVRPTADSPIGMMLLLMSSLYTGAMAVFVLWLITKLKWLFAFESSRRRFRG